MAASQIYRVGGAPDSALRLLALAGPGDLMTNTPLDFLTNHLNVRLDLLYILPNRPLPPVIPDHDVVFFASASPTRHARAITPVVCDVAAAGAERSGFLPASNATPYPVRWAAWPAYAARLPSPCPELPWTSIFGPVARSKVSVSGPYPCLIRPMHSHAGSALARVGPPPN